MRLMDMSEWDTYIKCMLIGRNAWYDYDRGYMDALDQVDDWLDAQPTLTISPCDFCKYNPPSSCDGKPCTMCPATTNVGGDTR